MSTLLLGHLRPLSARPKPSALVLCDRHDPAANSLSVGGQKQVEDHPQISGRQFLSLHAVLSHATLYLHELQTGARPGISKIDLWAQQLQIEGDANCLFLLRLDWSRASELGVPSFCLKTESARCGLRALQWWKIAPHLSNRMYPRLKFRVLNHYEYVSLS